MALSDILADSKTFTDDMEMILGDQKVKLGELRGLTTKQQKDLSDKIQSAVERERQATEMSTKATEIFNNLKALETTAAETSKTKPTGEEDDFESNNWWTPVRKRMSAQGKKIEDALAKLDTFGKSLERAASIWAQDRWSTQYEKASPRLKKSKDHADWDLTKVREYATKNQLVDEYGFPSIERAVTELTKATEIEEIKKQAREEGFKDGQTRARLAGQNRPSSATGGKKTGKAAVEEFGLEGLGDDVASDPELMEALETARQAFDPSQIQ